MITLIYNIIQENEEVVVYAILEDVVLTQNQTLYDPPEYGPGLCRAIFSLNDGEYLPKDENELIDYLENLDLCWKLEDNDEYCPE